MVRLLKFLREIKILVYQSGLDIKAGPDAVKRIIKAYQNIFTKSNRLVLGRSA
jgi:hypothetical protein